MRSQGLLCPRAWPPQEEGDLTLSTVRRGHLQLGEGLRQDLATPAFPAISAESGECAVRPGSVVPCDGGPVLSLYFLHCRTSGHQAVTGPSDRTHMKMTRTRKVPRQLVRLHYVPSHCRSRILSDLNGFSWNYFTRYVCSFGQRGFVLNLRKQRSYCLLFVARH